MPSVLIVDDEQHIRLLIEQALEELEDDGVELLTAPDGEVALDVVRNQAPDLVFLDVTMPKVSGFDACESQTAKSVVPLAMLIPMGHCCPPCVYVSRFLSMGLGMGLGVPLGVS